MGISVRKRVKIGKSTHLNLSKSGVSISQKLGPVTINSRGQLSINLGNGVCYRTSLNSKKSKKGSK